MIIHGSQEYCPCAVTFDLLISWLLLVCCLADGGYWVTADQGITEIPQDLLELRKSCQFVLVCTLFPELCLGDMWGGGWDTWSPKQPAENMLIFRPQVIYMSKTTQNRQSLNLLNKNRDNFLTKKFQSLHQRLYKKKVNRHNTTMNPTHSFEFWSWRIPTVLFWLSLWFTFLPDKQSAWSKMNYGTMHLSQQVIHSKSFTSSHSHRASITRDFYESYFPILSSLKCVWKVSFEWRSFQGRTRWTKSVECRQNF